MSVIKTFTDYINESVREYSYRIKTVSPLSDTDLEYMEQVLDKYCLKEITKPIKTIMQKHPLDFADITNSEVWIVDAVTQLPASAYVLQQELKLALTLPEKYIVVRSDNDPLETYTQEINAKSEIDIIAKEKGLTPAARLSTNRNYDIDEQGILDSPVYGNEYNKSLLDAIAVVKAERVSDLVFPDSEELNQGGDIKEAPPVVTDGGNFNKEIKDAPNPHTIDSYTDMLKNLRKIQKTSDPKLSTKNNYDNDEIKLSKKYNKYGATGKVAVVTITNKKQGIRKK